MKNLKDLLPSGSIHIQTLLLAEDPVMTTLLARKTGTTLENHGNGVDLEKPVTSVSTSKEILLNTAEKLDQIAVSQIETIQYGKTCDTIFNQAHDLAIRLRAKAKSL